MHFARLSAVLIGLAAFASAYPHPEERRMSWNPRSLRRRDGGDRNSKDTITIVDTTVVELTEQSRNSEVELTILVQEKIQIEDQKKKAKDNVRKNHYRNKNKDVVSSLFSDKSEHRLILTRTPLSLSSRKSSISETPITTTSAT